MLLIELVPALYKHYLSPDSNLPYRSPHQSLLHVICPTLPLPYFLYFNLFDFVYVQNCSILGPFRDMIP